VLLFYYVYFVKAQDKYIVNVTIVDINKHPVFMASVILCDNKNK